MESQSAPETVSWKVCEPEERYRHDCLFAFNWIGHMVSYFADTQGMKTQWDANETVLTT